MIEILALIGWTTIVLGLLVIWLPWFIWQRGRESVCQQHEWEITRRACLRCGREESTTDEMYQLLSLFHARLKALEEAMETKAPLIGDGITGRRF